MSSFKVAIYCKHRRDCVLVRLTARGCTARLKWLSLTLDLYEAVNCHLFKYENAKETARISSIDRHLQTLIYIDSS
jgi:hypothetical protein